MLAAGRFLFDRGDVRTTGWAAAWTACENRLMLLWAIGLVVLLALLAGAERYSSTTWRAGDHRALVDCSRCEVRYPRTMIVGSIPRCPEGHVLRVPRPHSSEPEPPTPL